MNTLKGAVGRILSLYLFVEAKYNYGHAVLSPDGSTMFFTSNAHGAHGQTDLFKVKILR